MSNRQNFGAYALHFTNQRQLLLLIFVLVVAFVGEINWIGTRRAAMSYEGRMAALYDAQLQSMMDEAVNSCGRIPTGFVHIGEPVIFNEQEYRCATDYRGKLVMSVTPVAMLSQSPRLPSPFANPAR